MTILKEQQDAGGPLGARSDAEALIKEARRLRRRRYLRIGTGLVVLVAGVAIGVALGQSGGRGHSGHGANKTKPRPANAATPPPAPRPPGTALPSSGLFTQITATANGLLITGETPATAASLDPTCVAATVDPTKLTLGALQTGSCNDPLLYGRMVEAVNTPIPKSNNATISINTANPQTGQVSDGPVVMTYGSFSDTRPVIAYGTQWLWIYDVETTAGPELLQVSTQSGDVVQTVHMPTLYRPLLAADDDGVWIGNSVEGSPGTALVYVSAGSPTPQVVIPATNQAICWITAAGTSAWLGIGAPQGGCVKESVERFADNDGSPLFETASVDPLFTVIGSESDGLWTMQWPLGEPSEEQIVHIDPDSGTQSIVATLPSVPLPNYDTYAGLTAGEGVYFEGSLYLLEPPYRFNGYLGYSSIVRIAAPATG